MDALVSIGMSINSLRANPLRSFLAMLGVVIGVAAVLSVVAFGEGHRRRIQQEIDRIGADVFWIRAHRPKINFDNDNHDHSSMSSQRKKLTIADAKALAKFATKVKKIAVYKNFFSTIFLNNQKLDLNIIFTEPAFCEIGKLKLVNGRFLSDFDIHLARKVCVVEYCDRLKKRIATLSPTNSYLYINNQKFKIVGFVEKKSEQFWSGFNSSIYVPISAKKYISFDKQIDKIYCKADQNVIKDAMFQTTEILKSKYRGEQRFEAYNAKMIFQSAEKLTRTASLVTAGIAMISLLVGSIGIMNIMLVTVTERTREIGLRKAVGAKIRDVLYQFLLEAILLTSIGGMIGIIGGLFLSKIVGSALNIPVIISVTSIVIGVFFSVVTGVISGYYPAFKASKLNPIEALRYE